MSFFHRPGDSSSDTSSSDDDEEELELDSFNDASQNSARDSTGTAEDIVTADSVETLSLTNTISNGGSGPIPNVDEARNMMIASMLEELSKYKAAEMLNSANVGNGRSYDKTSPEVQEFAKNLFARSSSILNEGGLMSVDSASDTRRVERAQYLSALERLSYRTTVGAARRASQEDNQAAIVAPKSHALVRRPSQQPPSFDPNPESQFHQLAWEMQQINVVRRPSAELRLAPISPTLRFRSHYQTTFEERGLLGRGGFGKVYHTYNIYDQREYAVKKIPLSPRLSQRYSAGGLDELKHILKEVQALASLDHCNVVRYHATWIEEPVTFENPSAITPIISQRGQRMIDDKPAASNSLPQIYHHSIDGENSQTMPVIGRIISATSNEGTDEENNSFDPFARSRDDDDQDKQLWSHRKAEVASSDEVDDTDVFSDGRSRHHTSLVSNLINDAGVYVLHVQMTMYPMTLADYMHPAVAPQRSSAIKPKHCYHLVPALRIILSILCGLQYIHSRGLIHRDIKPGNIFLTQLDFPDPLAFSREQGYVDVGSCPDCSDSQPRFLNPRIGDFGLVAELQSVAAAGDTLDENHTNQRAIGTEFYRPPIHRLNGYFPDEKVDVFALGIILVELLCSCSTRMERMRLLQHCQKGIIPPDLWSNLRLDRYGTKTLRDLETCLLGMIDPNPEIRWRSAMVKSRLDEILLRVLSSRAENDP